MFRIPRVLTIASVVLAVASLAGAQASSGTSSKGSAAAQTSKSSGKSSGSAKKSAATSMSASGKVAKFDAASNMLTVTTAKGDVMFMVPASATLKDGSQTIQASALGTLTGRQATVHYTESGGTKTATSVHLAAATSSKGAAKSTTAAPKSTAPAPKSK